MATLHTVNKTPFERGSLESCLKYAAPGAVLLLIEDGVYAAVAGSLGAKMLAGRSSDIRMCVLGPDLDARGIAGDRLADGIEVVGYEGFVALAAESDRVQSWL